MLNDELTRLLAAAATSRGCGVTRWLVDQDPDTAELIEKLKAVPTANLTQIYNALKAHDPELQFGRTTFNNHMRSLCSCQAA